MKPRAAPLPCWLEHRFGDVWRFRVDAQARATRPADQHRKAVDLPAVVTARAARLRDDEQRARLRFAHEQLQSVLLERIERPQWHVAALGKPDAGPGTNAFNLTRRGAWAAFVVGHDVSASTLGIDLEEMHEIDDPVDLAREHFTAAEIDALRAQVPGAARSRAFLRAWTRKEAVMKAVGLGVSLSARSFHVGIGADSLALSVAHDGRHWAVEVESLPDQDDTIMALARATAQVDPA